MTASVQKTNQNGQEVKIGMIFIRTRHNSANCWPNLYAFDKATDGQAVLEQDNGNCELLLSL